MSVGLLIITHNNIGKDLLRTATSMLGVCPLQTASMAISNTCNPEELLTKAQRHCKKLDQGDGVIVLTDMYGSTPSNIANRLNGRVQTRIIAGVNLPMLVRIMNYAGLNLEELAAKAVSGGHDGILLCGPETES